ncbi:MAG TPA: hypothetical protein VIG24_09245 [Acidimicrobiia bacterium]
MATNLTDIELDEVSLVDKGANQEAHIVLVKRSPLRRFADWVMGKSYDEGYGMARPMSQVMAEDDAQQQLARLMMALHESLSSIQGAELEASEKLAMMQQSAAEFAEAVDGIEVMKGLRDQIESLSSLDEIPAAIAAITKALGDEGEGEDTMTEPVKTEDPSVVEKSDEIAKALESEVAKREALEKKIAEMEALAKRAEITARVEKSMGSVPGATTGDLVDLLVAIHDGVGAEAAGKVEALLTASSQTVAESAVLEEVGKDAGAEADVFSRAQTIADELRKQDPTLTKEIALAKAFEQNPDLAAAAYAR